MGEDIYKVLESVFILYSEQKKLHEELLKEFIDIGMAMGYLRNDKIL